MGNGVSEEAIDVNDLDQHELIGAGALCQVYRATLKKDPSESVAVKRFYCPDLTTEDLEDFKRELELTSKMSSNPHIIQFIGGRSDPPNLYLVMELAAHGSVAKYLHNESKKLPWTMKYRMALDTAVGMEFLHKNKVLHRDLKSDNLLMNSIYATDPVVVKIADLGISKLFDPTKASNMTKGRGTTNWMAPEVLSGAENYSFPIDVYSYGVILWELLTREMPWGEVKMVFRIPQKVIDGERPAIPSDCPPKWQVLMTECWDGNPDKRPTFESIVTRLKEMKEDIAPGLVISASAKKLKRPKKKGKKDKKKITLRKKKKSEDSGGEGKKKTKKKTKKSKFSGSTEVGSS